MQTLTKIQQLIFFLTPSSGKDHTSTLASSELESSNERKINKSGGENKRPACTESPESHSMNMFKLEI